jgi:hypothetical protein
VVQSDKATEPYLDATVGAAPLHLAPAIVRLHIAAAEHDTVYDAFGVLWTTLPQKIDIFHSSSRNEVQLSPNAS